MAKRRKRTRWNGDGEDADGERPGRRSKRRGRRFERAQSSVAMAELPQRAKPPVTCYQCGHLVVTRSFVKHVSQSWDRAIVFPTLTCFQQCWTLEDPDSVGDKASVTEYLVSGAESCPHFTRGHPRNHEW
jgi:hypothetical protein